MVERRGFSLTSISAMAKNAIITGSMAFSMEPKDGLPEDGSTLPAKPSPSLSTRFAEKVRGPRIRGPWYMNLNWSNEQLNMSNSYP